MFENFKAYDDECVSTEDFGNATYLVMFNEKGYDDVINWAIECGAVDEIGRIGDKESCYYRYNCCRYCPIDEEEVPREIVIDFFEHCAKEKINASYISQKFKIKIQLVNGITIEPNLYSNDFHEIADVVRELLCEKLFAGQVKKITIE